MRRRPTSWWAKWISSTNPSSPSSASLKPRHWEVWPRCPFPPGEKQKSARSSCSFKQKIPLAIEITWPHMLSHLPRRFLFILLGPQGKAKSYNEIGRAIATLMVDDVSVLRYTPITTACVACGLSRWPTGILHCCVLITSGSEADCEASAGSSRIAVGIISHPWFS